MSQLVSDQYEEEINQFLAIVKASGAKKAIEIGAYQFGTSILLSEAMGPDSLVVCVDLPEKEHGSKQEHFDMAKQEAPGRLELVRGHSRAPATVETVAQILGGQADILFIDGDHDADAAFMDYMSYGALVKRLGAVAFHDICYFRLWPLWNKLRGSVPPNRSVEIIKDATVQDSCGIGVIFGRLAWA